MIIIGVTGSIGTGKTTISRMFAEEGIPTYNADQTVHSLLKEKHVISSIYNCFPQIVSNFSIDRKKLSKYIFFNRNLLKGLEKIIYPFLWKKEKEFLEKNYQKGYKIVTLDIPLLYENNRNKNVDYVLVSSVSQKTLIQRALKRPGMNKEKIFSILSYQMEDDKKKYLSDFFIRTDKNFSLVKEDVRSIIKNLL